MLSIRSCLVDLTLFFGWVLATSVVSHATEYHDSIERDFPLRSLGELRITNARGDIVIEGWAQDRIRLKAVRRADAPTEADAKRMFSYTDFRFKTVDRDIELSAEYGRGLNIEERLKERNGAQVNMDMSVLAPANLSLKVWAVSGKVLIKGWNSNLEIRSTQGPIQIESVKKGNISVLCPACSVQVKSVHSSVRCMGGSGQIQLADVQGSQIYVESEAGSVSVRGVTGEQLYVTKSGSVTGSQLQGHVEFHTRQGGVTLADCRGFVSGRTDSGSISARMLEWAFADKALIESVSGEITLALPSGFSGDVDLISGTGKVMSAFALTQPRAQPPKRIPTERVARRPFTRLMGIVGDGGDQLKLSSDTGNVSLVVSEPSAGH